MYLRPADHLGGPTPTPFNRVPMKKLLYATALTVSLVGCSEDKKSDPKPANPSQVDPRLKPAEAGGGAAPGANTTQGAVKGD